MICSIVVLYEPAENEIKHICDYYNHVDYILVLDNSKVSNSRVVKELIDEDRSDKLIYKHFGENIGLSKALNYGMTEAKKLDCDWALLMDSDSKLITDIVDIYLDYLEGEDLKKEIAVLAPVHIFDRSRKNGYCGYKNRKWAMTSGCFYNVDIFNEIHGFKEELFVDGLDIDYCYRAGEYGYKIEEIGCAQVRHFPGESREFKIGQKIIFRYGYASPWRYYLQAKALIWIILRYKSYVDLIKYLYKWLKIFLFFDNKQEYIKQMIKGTKEGVLLWKKGE